MPVHNQIDPRLSSTAGKIEIPEVLHRVNDFYDRAVKAMEQQLWSKQQPDLKKLEDDLAAIRKAIARKADFLQSEDPAILTRQTGDFVLADLTPTFTSVQAIANRTSTRKKLVTVALALAAYKSDKGKYPSSLTELTTESTVTTGKTTTKAPPYLKALPLDFFSEKGDKPFSYKVDGNGYVLYSVGENMKDDSGKDKDNGGDDIVIKK